MRAHQAVLQGLKETGARRCPRVASPLLRRRAPAGKQLFYISRPTGNGALASVGRSQAVFLEFVRRRRGRAVANPSVKP